MKKNGDKKQIYIALLFVVALAIGVGYAFLNSTLNITGNTTIKENTWDVHFENFNVTNGSVTATNAELDTNSTAVNYTITLQKPGDFYEFTVDVVNEGTIDAMVSTVTNTGLTYDQSKYLAYTVTYSDGSMVAPNQLLKAETGFETIKVRVEYKKNITVSDLPNTNQVLTLSFSANYVQADGSAVTAICKRASSLHSYYGTITFGRIGSGNTLVAGDAFDCDVNGDGVFNAENERFYYVTSLSTNSNYAVLIYYSNVSNGVTPTTSVTYAYDSNAVSGVNYNGPQTAKNNLPTTAQWKNVSLSSETRNIIDEQNDVKVNNFSYQGRAARLLTYQEVVAACGSTSIYPQNQFLLENTKYVSDSYVLGYWLETPKHMSAYYAWPVDGISKKIGGGVDHANDTSRYGVRPVIEVLKSRIRY